MVLKEKGFCMSKDFTRRTLLKGLAMGMGMFASNLSFAAEEKKVIKGFDETEANMDTEKKWEPYSDRKIRVGIAGYGVCKFGAVFGFQDHPNVEVVAVTDLIPERCEGLAKECHCSTTYPSLEEMVKDKNIEAVFVATDAPSHAKHCIEALKHGKHVASAVPAVFGSVDDANALYDAVKSSGLNYMLMETSAYRNDCYAMRTLYKAGALGELVYCEGEYYHYLDPPIDSYKGWRLGMPPQWYPTHSNAYYICIGGGHFTEVSCFGMPSHFPLLKAENNVYKNPFGTEIALFRTREGGMARMGVSWDTPGFEGEVGRVRGQKGSVTDTQYQGLEDVSKINIKKPPLPPDVNAGGHGGSHGYLTDEFIRSIIENRKPFIDIAMALNITVPGTIAHQSALKEGELLKVPVFTF